MTNAGEAKTRRVRRVAIAGRPTLRRSHRVMVQGGRGMSMLQGGRRPNGPPARA
jgi:hypothetical protein